MSYGLLVLVVVLSFVALISLAAWLTRSPSSEVRRSRDLEALTALPAAVIRLRLEELEYFDFAPGLGLDPPDGTAMRDTPEVETFLKALDDDDWGPKDFEAQAFGEPLEDLFRELARAEARLGHSPDPRWGPWVYESGAWEPIVLHTWALVRARSREANEA